MLKYEVIIRSTSVVYLRYNDAHRNNRPATIYKSGNMHWLEYGYRHRKDGPARIWHDGDEEYWMRGEQC